VHLGILAEQSFIAYVTYLVKESIVSEFIAELPELMLSIKEPFVNNASKSEPH